MKDWFETLEARERIFVGGGAVVVIIAIVYGLLWAPLAKKHTALRADVALWQDSLADLRALETTAGAPTPATTSTTAARSNQSPIIVVDQTLRSRGLDRYRRSSRPTTSNGIRVEFEDVSFDELVRWLGDLSQQYGMHVQASSFTPGSQGSEAGRVNANLTLERAL
ncbi:MAG: type II secretion system protein M [Gammaproteobacteria bacterium]|nr:type II secretion system protein M [Gammaproteobacteria bacterium]